MAKPIQKRLLIHEAEYRKKIPDLGWGEEFDKPKVLRLVRFEPKTKLVKTSTGDSVESTTTLFVDEVFSTKVSWEMDSKVIWEDKEYLVRGIDSYYDANRLHHLEVRLI